MSFTTHFETYRIWREGVAAAARHLERWLADNDLLDGDAGDRFRHIRERLAEDRLVVAFVAEFSRGKSELINALFFADRGGRVLPSSAGRTTMCPTEIAWRHGATPRISLLPIETRAEGTGIAELRGVPEAWIDFPFDPGDRDGMVAALRRIGDVKRIPADAAGQLGFAVGDGTGGSLVADAEGRVEVPRWRHALINFPHPLLEQGLVILDTPGLNAIGAEPELTLSLLPNAHAVLFVLAADAGVTESDLAIWREHVGSGAGRLAVLNKIDGLWDELRPQAEVDAEIARQVRSCANILGLPPEGVFPVSARKALVARVRGDAALLAKSRLPMLEDALARDLLPARREIVARSTADEALRLAAEARELLRAKEASVRREISELVALRGKNESIIAQAIVKAKADKEAYERGLREFHATRSVFGQLSETLYAHLSLSALRVEVRQAREAMRDARFTPQLLAAMAGLFAGARERLAAADSTVAEISAMMAAMRERFGALHGIALEAPPAHSLAEHRRQIDELEARARGRFGGFLSLLTRDKQTITRQFFESVASQLRRVFDHANRDAEHWLRALMSPLENQIREVHRQLRHRLDGVKRIHDAAGELEERIDELGREQQLVEDRLRRLALIAADLEAAIRRDRG